MPSTSMVEGALMDNMGTPTMVSMVAKGRSDAYGAGMSSLVKATKKEYRKSSGKRTPGGPCSRCPASKPIQDPATCTCYVQNSAAARKKGICADRMVTYKDGTTKLVHYVAGVSKGQVRCLKAGGKTARKVLGNEGCPPGKFLAPVKRSVPVDIGSDRRKTVTVQQCVRPKGQYKQFKDCPSNQVLVKMPRDGGNRCVKPETARAKGYTFLRQGTLPVRHRVRKGTVPMAVSLGY